MRSVTAKKRGMIHKTWTPKVVPLLKIKRAHQPGQRCLEECIVLLTLLVTPQQVAGKHLPHLASIPRTTKSGNHHKGA